MTGYLEKRDRARIYADILEHILVASLKGEKLKITRIQDKGNVPFGRFKEYITDLQGKGLLQIEPEIVLTQKGVNYIEEYRRVKEFLEKFGLIRVRNGKSAAES